MSRLLLVSSALAATLLCAGLLPPHAAYAGWEKDGGTVLDEEDLISVPSSGGGNGVTGTATFSTATGSGAPPPTRESYQYAPFDQDFIWSGGGTPTTSFTVPGSGELKGSVSYSKCVVTAWSRVRFSTLSIEPTWTYPDTVVEPSGNIPATVSGSTATLRFWLDTYAKGAGGSSSHYGASYDVTANAEYSVGNPNP